MFLWNYGNTYLPMDTVASVGPLRSSWETYDVSTRQWIIFRSSEFRCSAILQAPCGYCSICWRFFWSSSSRSSTLVVRNEMVGWMSDLARLLTNKSFATRLWNRMARSSIRYFPLLFVLSRLSSAGLTTSVVTSLENSSKASSMYLVIDILNALLSVHSMPMTR